MEMQAIAHSPDAWRNPGPTFAALNEPRTTGYRALSEASGPVRREPLASRYNC